jgi:hypothetical protein
VLEFICIIKNLLARCGGHGTGRHIASVDAYSAYPATAMRAEFRIVAEMRDVYPGVRGGLDDGLILLERDSQTVDVQTKPDISAFLGINLVLFRD